MSRRDQVVLITGATRGIGRATALELARRGHTVMATGRNRELLASLEKETGGGAMRVAVTPLDVTDEGSVREAVSRTTVAFGRIDALVNNAGYGLWGPLEDLEPDELRAVFETNVFGPHRLCRLVLPGMRQRGSGTIVNVGSVAGLIGSPAGGAYAATKFALRAMSQVLRLEVSHFGVRVALIEPGLFRTDFHDNTVNGRRVLEEGSAYRDRTGRLQRAQTGRQGGGGDPGRVARRIRQVIEGRHPRARYTVGLDAWAGAWAARLVPDRLLGFAVKKTIGW